MAYSLSADIFRSSLASTYRSTVKAVVNKAEKLLGTRQSSNNGLHISNRQEHGSLSPDTFGGIIMGVFFALLLVLFLLLVCFHHSSDDLYYTESKSSSPPPRRPGPQPIQPPFALNEPALAPPQANDPPGSPSPPHSPRRSPSPRRPPQPPDPLVLPRQSPAHSSRSPQRRRPQQRMQRDTKRKSRSHGKRQLTVVRDRPQSPGGPLVPRPWRIMFGDGANFRVRVHELDPPSSMSSETSSREARSDIIVIEPEVGEAPSEDQSEVHPV